MNRLNDTTRRNYLRAIGATGIVGPSSTAALSESGAAAAVSHTLTIEGVDTRTDYVFSVSGDLASNGGLTGEDSIDGSTATGAVGGGRDSYSFSGEITEFSMSSDADLVLNGEEVDVTEFLPRTLEVRGVNTHTDYVFGVTGGISGRRGHSKEDNIDIENGRVSGAVGPGRDIYAFSGEITDFSMSSDADLVLDGEEIDVTELLPRTMEIRGVDTRTDYAFNVTGGISGRRGHSKEDNIDIKNGRVRGAVGPGRDLYAFSGEITEFSMSSDADLVLDGEEIDVTELLPRTLTFEGTGTRAEYSFSVSGGISGRFGHSGEDDIDIENGRVDGAVGGGRDAYAFSGDVAEIVTRGEADVYVDGERVDSASNDGNADLKLGYNARSRSHKRGNTYENFADLSGWQAERGRLVSNGDWDGNDGGSATLVGTTSENRIRMAADFNSANFAYRDPSVAVRLRGPANETLRVELWADTSDDQFVTSRYLSEKHGWIRLPISPTAINGRPDLADIDRVTIDCYTGGKDIRIDVDDIRTTRKRDNGAVLFIFDDGNETDYTVAYNDLSARGWTGSSAVIPTLVGGRGNLSRSQMDEMHANGWTFPNHPQGNTRADGLGSVSGDRAEDMMRENKRWLLDNGYERGANTIVWPFGDFDREALQIAGDYYRLAWGGGSSTANGTVTEAGWVPRVELNEAEDVANALDAIDYAHRTDTVLTFKTHGMGGNNIGRTGFNRVLDRVEERDLDVLTTSDFADEQ